MAKLRSFSVSLISLLLAAAVAGACGHDELLLAGLDAGPSSGGANNGGVASKAGGPDSSVTGGSTASGGTASGGTASGGGNGDAESDGLAGAAGALADASGDASGDAAGSADAPDAPGAVVPDFKLVDENPASSRYKQQVSPRDYLGQVSAWYFGHST